MNAIEELSDAQRQGTVLLLWASGRRGTRSVGRTLAGLLRDEPHGFNVVEVDLHEELAGQSVLQTLASWTGMRLDTAALAARGWPMVDGRLRATDTRAVLCLDPAAAAAAVAWRESDKLQAPVVGLSLGMHLDPTWGRSGVDRLGVADAQMGERALELGIAPECIVPCGIPVCGGFSSISPDSRPSLRRRFGLPEQRPVLLVVTDGLEHELTGLLFQLGLVAQRAMPVFDVAHDEGTADLLRRRAGLYGVEARMFGKVEEAGELWGSADLVMARPHLYVEQRAIALRLPFVHLLPQDEWEEETARVYAERDIGRVVAHVSTLAAELEMQLEPDVLGDARARISAISKRVAATDIARFVAQVSAGRERILQERRSAAAGAEPGPRPASGPLETIGASSGGPETEEQPMLLVDLEAAEAEANRQVSAHQAEVDLWNRRAALAAERGAADLEREAAARADKHLAAMHRALAELGRIGERRTRLEQAQRQQSRLEQDFRKLEVEDALEALKRRLERDD